VRAARVACGSVQRDELIDYCLGKAGAYLDTPWEDDLVAKVGGKIFCFLGAAKGPAGVTVKNTREGVAEWRARFPEHVDAPRYLNKALWNRVDLAAPGGPDDDDVRELVDDSYELVVEGLPKSRRPA
jgi:predicted DNA-binding protein (MmcQ/YjbR family)